MDYAIDKAIDDMPEDYELKPFLIAHKAEVKDMCLTEYNEAETMQMFKEEYRAEGLVKGRILAHFEDGLPIDDIALKTDQTVDFVKDTLRENGML